MSEPQQCNVYLWLDNNVPFYVGIGSKKRSSCRQHNKQAEGRRKTAESSKSFRIDFLFTGSRASCEEIERHLISCYGSVTVGGLLFNFTPGGEGGCETSLLTRESYGRLLQGTRKGGKTTQQRHPEVAKQKGRLLGQNHGAQNGKKSAVKLRKPVVCKQTGAVFSSAGEASRAFNVSRSLISRCCNGHLETAGGFNWYFLEGEVNGNP